MTEAEKLHHEALTLLTIAQATGHEGTQEQAFELLQQSAAMNYAPAWLELGHCYDKGIGTDYDEDEMDDCYRKAADLGNAEAALRYAHNQYYHYYNHEEAYSYVQQALHADESGAAHYLLGLLYYHGEGCEPDHDKSYEAHATAAGKGHADAMFELYVYYSQGLGCKANAATAFEWNRKAADLGQYRACYNMGWFYETGTHVAQDINEAFRYYTMASEGSNAKATAYLGVMYEKGMVKPVETLDQQGLWSGTEARRIAENYYRRSKEQGFFELEEFLAHLGVSYEG